jgi:iron complex outermembrane receptor protein
VDDNNSMAADSSTLLDIKSSWQKNWQQVLWQWWLAIDNVSNSSYAGAVVVNQANGRYFEPGTPRQFQLGFRVQLALD